MKTILITGGKSFLAKELSEYFSNKYKLIVTDRSTLDVSNKKSVDLFFENNSIDYVFHTAISGGSRLKEDTFEDFLNNLNMFQNLANNSNKFELLFSFGSGAEFDRRKNIDNFTEEELINSNPQDYYGHSKNIIARQILKRDNVVNIRLFGCFGKHENDTRFIKSSINKCINNEEVLVDDKEMDFIFTKDLFILIENYLENGVKYKDINAVYNKKVSLEHIANYIKDITSSKSLITVKTASEPKNYTGDSSKIDTLKLKFVGLDNSIKEMYNDIKRRKS